MPFESEKQSKACFATGGFGGDVDCEEWAHKTDYKHLPKKKKKKDFKEWLEDADPRASQSLSEMDAPIVAPAIQAPEDNPGIQAWDLLSDVYNQIQHPQIKQALDQFMRNTVMPFIYRH